MDIKSIAVENFRSHTAFTIPLESKVTILTGPNGSGKSSLLEAVSTCLIGENTWTDRDGIKLPALIKKGAKKAIVSVMGKRRISRIITQDGSKLMLDLPESGDAGGTPLTQVMLLQNLEISATEVKASLVSQAFLTLPVKEQKEVLFALLGSKLTLDRIGKYVPEEAQKVWAKMAASWIEDHTEEKYVNLDKVYRYAFDTRRNYKAKVNAPAADPDQEKRARRMGEISQQIATANFDNERIRAAREEVKTLPELEARLRQYQELAKDEDLDQKLQAAKDEVNELARKEASAYVELENANAEIARLKALDVGKGQKVRCPIGLECPHDEVSIRQKSTLAAGTSVAKAGALKAARFSAKEAVIRLDTLANKAKASEKAEQEIDSLDQEITHLKDLAKKVRDEKEVDLTALKREKAELERQLGAAVPKAAPEDKTIGLLDQVVEALDANGIKTKLVRKGVGDLEEEANLKLKKFGGGQITFFMDSDFQPTILLKGAQVTLGEMSEGERLNASLILQDVFAQWSGVNLVVLDNVDLLDPEAYRRFVDVAQSLKSKVLIGLANQAHAEKLGARSVDVVILQPQEKRKAGK